MSRGVPHPAKFVEIARQIRANGYTYVEIAVAMSKHCGHRVATGTVRTWIANSKRRPA